MKYENQCGSCLEFKDKRGCSSCYDDSFYEQGYCDYYKSYYYPDDSCTSHYKNKYTYVSPPCYITTIVCNILGFNDNCYILNELRKFRNNVMQKDPKYSNLLLEYDAIGPDLAFFIEREYKETQDKEMWIQFYNFYLNTTANLVKEEHYDEAIDRYRKMVKSLKEYFGIPEDYKPRVENYDYRQDGHGKIMTI